MDAAARILIVDDALFFRMVMRDMLLKVGCQVVGEAVDGVRAGEVYPELRPDVVFLDLFMPNIDGLSTLRNILAVDPRARVIVCSSNGKEEIIKAAMLQGARDFLVKPLDEARVLNALRRVLKAKSGGARSIIEELLAWHDLEDLLLRSGLVSPEDLAKAREALRKGLHETLPGALRAEAGIGEEDLHALLEDIHRDVSVAVILLQARAITMEQLRCALVLVRNSGRRLGFTLVEQGFCAQAQLAEFLKKVKPYEREPFA